ncbi:MAG: DUF4149 domain-containing protein [Acidiferrobacterales bacterium]
MLTLVVFVTLLALVIWVGGLVFFSLIVAPLVFSILEQTDAGRFVRAIFPRYYGWGLGAGVVALVGLAALGALAGAWAPPLLGLIVLVFAMLCLTAYSLVLVPKVNAARDAGEAEQEAFQQLHKRSVRINIAVLCLGLLALAIVAYSVIQPISL